MQGAITIPKGGVPVLSEAVGWRIGFWWEGTREWVDGEVLSYRASDARHLVVFADGEFEWMSLAVETIRWVANTRERGNRLSPLSFGLDQETTPPKGREAVDWVVDVYDKNTNQMQRVEISGFDSCTGKHKVVYSESRKVSWISLTASKIVWRFPPGLPTPSTDVPNTTDLTETTKGDTGRQGSATRGAVQIHTHHKTKGHRHKRKSVPVVTTPDATAPEGNAVVSPSAAKGLKKGVSKGSAVGGKGTTVAKGGGIKPRTLVPVVVPSKPEAKILSSASPVPAAGVPSKRTAEATHTSAPPAKRNCSAEAAPVVISPAIPADSPAHASEAILAEANRRRRSTCVGSGAQPQVQDHRPQQDASGPATAAQPEPKVVQFSAPRDLPGPASVANVRPASIWPIRASQTGMREAAFIRSSLTAAQSMQRQPGMFRNSVQCLLAATERRQQFVRALINHLGDSTRTHAHAPAMATPPLRPAGSMPALQNATLMTIPTDPRRASKAQVLEDPNKAVATPHPVAPVAVPQPLKHAPPSLSARSGAVSEAALHTVPRSRTQTIAAHSQPAGQPPAASPATGVAPIPVPAKPASVAQFTPKFAPLSSFQRGHAGLGAAPVALPAVAPDSKTVQELLKQRSPGDGPCVPQPVTLSMSMVAKAVSAAALPSNVSQVVRSPPSDQTSSSCKIDDVKCTSGAKLGGVRQQQAARVSAATWQVSQMQNAGSQKQGITVNSKCDIHTESRNGSARVPDGARATSLNRTVSSNVRTANLRWGGAPLVAARASIGLKGGSAGSGSAGGRACG